MYRPISLIYLQYFYWLVKFKFKFSYFMSNVVEKIVVDASEMALQFGVPQAWVSIRRRRRRRGSSGTYVPPKIRENIFAGNYHVKSGHFSGKYHVKFGNFVNFSGNVM